MGMFDTVTARCPECGGKIEWQSKAGECCLVSYDARAVPASIAEDLDGAYSRCPECGEDVELRQVTAPARVPMYAVTLGGTVDPNAGEDWI
ncbi:hypothetical protein GCM10011587_04160 [Pyruvatibacter mobilis]|nr:hypothetical protein GCM10011587_04160 [Pyruvatibacter mobilis]